MGLGIRSFRLSSLVGNCNWTSCKCLSDTTNLLGQTVFKDSKNMKE